MKKDIEKILIENGCLEEDRETKEALKGRYVIPVVEELTQYIEQREEIAILGFVSYVLKNDGEHALGMFMKQYLKERNEDEL